MILKIRKIFKLGFDHNHRGTGLGINVLDGFVKVDYDRRRHPGYRPPIRKTRPPITERPVTERPVTERPRTSSDRDYYEPYWRRPGSTNVRVSVGKK